MVWKLNRVYRAMLDEIIAPLFTTEWGRRLGWIMMIGMLLLLVFTIFDTVVLWHADYSLTRMQKKSAPLNLSASEVTKLISQIPERHIFGKQSVVDATLPITSLQLHLVGVIKADSEKLSRVIISEGSQLAKVYQVGDSLTPDVKVNAITQEGVILDNGGRLEKLPLQRTPLLFRGSPKSLLQNDKTKKE